MNKYVDLPAPKDFFWTYQPLNWAKEHCKSYLTTDAVQKEGNYYYRFFFSDEKDIAWFKLRWS